MIVLILEGILIGKASIFVADKSFRVSAVVRAILLSPLRLDLISQDIACPLVAAQIKSQFRRAFERIFSVRRDGMVLWHSRASLYAAALTSSLRDPSKRSYSSRRAK